MRKIQELADPNSCLNRADDDEMTFVLLGRDICAPDTIRDWVSRRVNTGKNKLSDAQIQEALTCADRMETERTAYRLREKVGGAE